MAKSRFSNAAKPTTVFPPTTVRLDPDLLYRAKKLALENAREGLPESGISKLLNTALADYLKKRGA